MTASRIHLLLASLMGASGVALWASATHGGDTNAQIAAQMLLIHAAAVIGLTAARKQGLLHDRAAALAVSALILGVVLFAADLVVRERFGTRLFPFAAPLGGVLAILGWLLAAGAALMAHKPR